MSTVVLYCWCHNDLASVLLYFTLRMVLLLVCCLHKEVYLQTFECVVFHNMAVARSWQVGHVNRLNTQVGT